MKKRKESFFGLHFDFHAQPTDNKVVGSTLREEDIREICRLIKPDFIQIDCKGHPGWASYPSKIGNAMPEFEGDPLALWRKVTKEENVALYLHYSGVYDIKYCREHPEETVMEPDGSLPLNKGRTRTDGKYVDELLIPQLLEILEKYGVDGFWIDGDCWASDTDFRPEALAKFEKETGIDLNGGIPATKDDPYYDEYREYYRELFRRYVRHYVDTVHSKFPEAQIASNWSFSDHMPERISANVDYLSGDLNPKNSLNSARYAARALAQQDYPWDLMSWNFRIQIGDRAGCAAKHVNQILQEAASVISLGGAYQNYIMQFKDGSPNIAEIRNLAKLSDFMRERQAYCFRGTPVHQAALLLSTYDRARESKRLYSRNGYEKIMGMTALLCDVGQSLEIVCEHTLEKGCDAYKMIVVPELYRGLSDNTLKMLLDYARNGGNLVIVGKNTCKIFSEAGAPITVTDITEFFNLGEKAYDNGGDNGHGGNAAAEYRSYYFTLDGKELGALFSPCEITSENGSDIAYLQYDPRSEKLPLATVIPYGDGRITAIGFDIGSQYLSGSQYLHRTLMRDVTEMLYTPKVRIESVCGRLEITALEKDGQLTVQLLNAGGSHSDSNCATDDYIPPVLDAVISVELPEKPLRLMLRPENRSLPFIYKDGRAYFRVDRINIHSIVEIVTK